MWLLKLNRRLELEDWSWKWVVTRKAQLVSFERSGKPCAIDVEMDWPVLQEKSFKMLELSFPSKLNWGSYSASVAETASEKIGTLILSIKFISLELALYLYKFTIRRHTWNTVAVSGLVLLTDTWICSISCRNVLYGTVAPSLAASLELLAHRQNVTSLSLFCRYYFGRCFKQDELIPLPGSCGRSNHYSNRLHDFCQYS